MHITAYLIEQGSKPQLGLLTVLVTPMNPILKNFLSQNIGSSEFESLCQKMSHQYDANLVSIYTIDKEMSTGPDKEGLKEPNSNPARRAK